MSMIAPAETIIHSGRIATLDWGRPFVGGHELWSDASRLDRTDALRLYTQGSAWFSREEKRMVASCSRTGLSPSLRRLRSRSNPIGRRSRSSVAHSCRGWLPLPPAVQTMRQPVMRIITTRTPAIHGTATGDSAARALPSELLKDPQRPTNRGGANHDDRRQLGH
jgi:hypothetical protein